MWILWYHGWREKKNIGTATLCIRGSYLTLPTPSKNYGQQNCLLPRVKIGELIGVVRKHIRGAAYIQDRGTRKYSQWNCLPPSLLMGTIFYVFYVCSWSMLNVLSSCLHCVGCIDLLHLPTYLQAKECYHNANIIEIQNSCL